MKVHQALSTRFLMHLFLSPPGASRRETPERRYQPAQENSDFLAPSISPAF